MEGSDRAQAVARARLVEPWQALKMAAASALAAPLDDPLWLDRVLATLQRSRDLTAEDVDAALYLMLQTATHDFDRYSACHALFCVVIADLSSEHLGWPREEVDTLGRAALTMNVGMQSLQDAMARQLGPLTEEQKRLVDEHPALSAQMLGGAGVDDALWLEVVRRHHHPGDPDAGPEAAQRLAQLLQRIDVFTAKLSRRKSRTAASATVAARDACLDASGRPDALGVTMLRVLGLYPPGSYVQLSNGEIGVVTRRGSKAHTPLVACLRRVDGALLSSPTLRDTGAREFGIRKSLSADEVRIGLNHERTLAAWWA